MAEPFKVHFVLSGHREDALWHQLRALRLPPGEQMMSPRGSSRKTSLDEQAGGAASCASPATPRQLPASGEGEQQEGRRKRNPSATASGTFPATAPGNPSQMEDGALRQRENPGLVSLHKRCVHGFVLSAPSCVATEFGTNRHKSGTCKWP